MKESPSISIREELVAGLRIRVLIVLTILLDLAFLSIWVIAQWLFAEYIINPLRVDGFDGFALVVAQYSFTSSTLATVAPFIWLDLVVIYRRVRQAIKDWDG